MREYELIYIIHPDLEDAAIEEVVSKVNSWITDGGGKILKSDSWGKKKLAYPINKQTEGSYIRSDIEMPPTFGVQLERNIQLHEQIIRFLLVAK